MVYKQRNVELIKHYQDDTLPSGMTLDGKDVIVKLTQEETKAFAASPAEVQVRVLTVGNDSYASQIFKIQTADVLNEEILQDD